MGETIGNFLPQILVLLFAVVVHEVMHGVVALALGDTTARDAGRLTLNPLPHIDPFGSLLLPGMLILLRAGFFFGYAKPVPVRFDQLRWPRGGGALVGVAGPASNLALAVLAALAMRVILSTGGGAPESVQHGLVRFCALVMQINVGLALFNMLPIPPADGSRVVEWLLPERLSEAYSSLGRYGMIVMMLLVSVPGALRGILTTPYLFLVGILQAIAGL
jgi:Zn-dependent protease